MKINRRARAKQRMVDGEMNTHDDLIVPSNFEASDPRLLSECAG